MAGSCVHPAAEDVGRLLGRLFGKRVVAKRGQPLRSPAMASAYVGTDGQIVAACAFDLAAANYAAAALAMMPPTVAAAAIRAVKVGPDTLDNLREVCNIMTQLFDGSSSHVKLRDVAKVVPPLPADLSALMTRPVKRVDLDIDIAGYGKGTIALLFAAPPVA